MADGTVEQARKNLRAFIRAHETWLAALPIQHAGSPRLWKNIEHLVDALIAAVRAEQAEDRNYWHSQAHLLATELELERGKHSS